MPPTVDGWVNLRETFPEGMHLLCHPPGQGPIPSRVLGLQLYPSLFNVTLLLQ